MALLGTLRTHLEAVSKKTAKTGTGLDNLDMVVIPQLRAQASNLGKGLETLDLEFNRSASEFDATISASDARVMALSNDYDKIHMLAQHVADTTHSLDAMQAAAETYGEVSDRVGYDGNRLEEVCTDRIEMTQAITSLMGHLEQARKTEADFRSNATVTYRSYADTLRAQRQDLANAMEAEDNQIVAALARKSTMVTEVASLEAERANAQDEAEKLEGFLDHMTTVLEDRLVNILKVTNMCDDVIHSVTMLKVKAHVRSVSVM